MQRGISQCRLGLLVVSETSRAVQILVGGDIRVVDDSRICVSVEMVDMLLVCQHRERRRFSSQRSWSVGCAVSFLDTGDHRWGGACFFLFSLSWMAQVRGKPRCFQLLDSRVSLRIDRSLSPELSFVVQHMRSSDGVGLRIWTFVEHDHMFMHVHPASPSYKPQHKC